MRMLILLGVLTLTVQTSSSAMPQHGGMIPIDSRLHICAPIERQNKTLNSSWQEYGVIFTGTQAKALLRQCSRATPEKITGQWNPSSEQIAELEGKFLDFKRTLKRPVAQLISFYRQYAGFISNGRKIVYVNLFPKNTDTEWKSRAVVVCDGGEQFWGVEFEVETGKFVNAAFNGFA